MYPHEYPLNTHCLIPGTTGSGKSKLIEDMVRAHVLARPRPDCTFLLDWHGTLYEAAKDYLAFLRPEVPIVLLNPSNPTVVIPYDPFRSPPGANISAHVSRTADTILQACGADRMSDLPTFSRVVKMLLTWCCVTRRPIQDAMALLQFHHRLRCHDAAEAMPTPRLRDQWVHLASITNPAQWDREVVAVENRLDRFISSDAINLFTGTDKPGLDLNQCIADGAIILVNLRPSGFLSEDSARLFASLLLSDLLHVAVNNAALERPCFVYLDECQMYLSDQSANMLDATRKAGVRATLIFHDFGEFHDKPRLVSSMKANCGIKYAFRQESFDDAIYWAQQLFMDKINERQIKEVLYMLETEYVLEDYETTTEGWSSSQGETESEGASSGHGEFESEHGEGSSSSEGHSSSHGFTSSSTSSESTTRSTRYAPRQHRVIRSINEYTREEKVSMVAGVLMKMRSRTCCRKVPLNDAEPFEVPFVDELLLNPEDVLAFEKGLPAAIPLEDAQRKQLEASHPERSTHEPQRRHRAKKEPARLFEP